MGLTQAAKDLLDEYVGVKGRSATRLVILGEPRVYDIVNATELTLRFSDIPYSTGTGDTPANTAWLPRFVVPDFRASLGYSSGVVGHAGQIQISTVELINEDGYFDGLLPAQALNYMDDPLHSWDG